MHRATNNTQKPGVGRDPPAAATPSLFQPSTGGDVHIKGRQFVKAGVQRQLQIIKYVSQMHEQSGNPRQTKTQEVGE